MRWVGNLSEIKSLNPRSDSYSLKHLFERSPEGFYLTNGAFKGVMNRYGFKSQVVNDGPNEIYNVSESSINNIRKSLE